MNENKKFQFKRHNFVQAFARHPAIDTYIKFCVYVAAQA
jgi:hypothetical protein